jgi:hypothetical protein
MGVDRLPSGSYRARLMVDGQTYTATLPTQGEADEWLVVARGRAIEAWAARGLTVEHYAQRWLGSFVDDAFAVVEFRHDVQQHLLPALGTRPLAEVDTAEVTALLEQVRMTASPAAVRQFRSTLQELFNDAVADGLLPRSPLDRGTGRSRIVDLRELL